MWEAVLIYVAACVTIACITTAIEGFLERLAERRQRPRPKPARRRRMPTGNGIEPRDPGPEMHVALDCHGACGPSQ